MCSVFFSFGGVGGGWLDTERLSIVLDLFKLKESDLVGNVGNKR